MSALPHVEENPGKIGASPPPRPIEGDLTISTTLVSTLPTPIRLGVSACLLGAAVRYDGGDKRDACIVDTLESCFELIPLCPEVGIGLGVPRSPIRLEGSPPTPRAVGVIDRSMDFTDRLEAYGREAAGTLRGISGYIFKSRSPSCGLAVEIHGGEPGGRSRGIFARALLEELPLLPVEEEAALRDRARRENFLERIYAYRRWQELEDGGITVTRLVEFHASHRPRLLIRDPVEEHRLASLLAKTGDEPIATVAARYAAEFMATFAQPAPEGSHAMRDTAADISGAPERDKPRRG